MTSAFPRLRERYEFVAAQYHERFPDDAIPPFPETTKPNEVVMAIDGMLAKLQDRPPLVIREAEKPYFPIGVDPEEGSTVDGGPVHGGEGDGE